MTGDSRRIHKEELYDLFSSPIRSRRMRWAGHMVSRGERGCAYRALVGWLEEKRTL